MNRLKKLAVFISLFLCITLTNLYSYKLRYAEEYYQLYHLHLNQYPEDINSNIWYLEQALSSDFANPLNALTKINNKEEWERYRNLFRMHCNIKLTESYRLLASKYDKRVAYFYNAPFKETNKKSLKIARANYENALYYWEESKKWSELAYKQKFIYFDTLQYWMDENYRIQTGDLDYGKHIQKDLDRVTKVLADFEAMDESTY